MAGGGAAAASDISVSVKEPYGLILRGYTGIVGTEGASWADASYEKTSTYAAEPSMMRYIHDYGITAVGGNPYEGVSAPSMDDQMDEVIDQVGEIQSKVDDVDTLAVHVAGAVTNSATVISDINVGTIFNGVINDAISQAAVAIATAVTDALSEATSLLSTADSAGQIGIVKVAALEADGIAVAGAELTDITTKASALGLEASTDIDTTTGIASVLTKHTDVDVVSDSLLTDSQSLESSISSGFDSASRGRVASLVGDAELSMLTMANNLYGQAFNSASSSISSTNALSIQTAKDIIAAAGTAVQPSGPMLDATQIARMGATECIGLAVQAATSAISDSVVSEMVTAFRNEALKTHLRSVGRFAAGMSDINAVNSSAFIWGMAAMESDHENVVAKFQAEVRLNIFNNAFNKFVEFLVSNIASYMQVYSTQMSTFTQGYGQNGQVVSNMVGQFVSSYVQSFAEYLRTYTNDKSLDAQVFNVATSTKKEMATAFAGMQVGLFERILQSKLGTIQTVGQLEEGAIARAVESRTRLYMQGFEKQIETALASAVRRTGMTESLFKNYFDGSVRSELDERAQSVAYVLNNTDQSIRKEITDVELNRATTTLLLEANRIKHVASHEEFETNLEVDVNAAHWDMELFTMAGNIIGSAAGAVVHRPGKPSRTQSVLGGALAAASIAAAIPTAGTSTVIGAAIAGGAAGSFM